MKSIRHFAGITAATLCLIVFVPGSASFAATNPLNDPTALALDAAGNLWVVNQGSNRILKFNPSYVLQPKATITQGLDTPTGLAFDSSGNLWVVNSGASNVIEYTNGVQNTAATISVDSPSSIAIDGLANIWVQTGPNSVNVYVKNYPYAAQPTLLKTYTPGTSAVYGVAIAGGSLAWGSLNQASLTAIEQELTTGPVSITINSEASLTVAGGANGAVFMGDFDGTVNVYNPVLNKTTQSQLGARSARHGCRQQAWARLYVDRRRKHNSRLQHPRHATAHHSVTRWARRAARNK